ncbi:MAG: efflux RND transporter periplasmic adaptor subunit [Planctomycetaceae bacterium]|nr:efflux RND transporter periplasmic adaptor subunit [Planctomycetaceae bacterium]
MRTFLALLVGVAVLAGLGTTAYGPAMEYWAKRNQPAWRTARVEQGDLVAVVNSTGTVKPKLQVVIGSFVSGPIQELFCEFNQEVKKGDLLARIDPRIYESNVARDRAALANREADVGRMRVLVEQAVNDEQRTQSLRKKDAGFITQSEIDKVKFDRLSLEAQLKVSQTAVDQAQAILENSLANLNYTEIRAPVDGMIINRKIDPGQTLAAQFQTPELFIMAPDMRTEMHIHASVDEADIGLIQDAQERKYPVTFTVDAHPDELFDGVINEIRLSSATTQNVVTYPVVVSAPNPDLKLLPGMTASLSFQVDHRDDVVKIPNAALRFYPAAKHVRPADLPILEGNLLASDDQDGAQQTESSLSAMDRTERRTQRNRRHVWVTDGHLLRAVEVTTGLSDSQFTEMTAGTLKKDDMLVVGIRPAQFAAIK